MSEHAERTRFGAPSLLGDIRDTAHDLTGFWWSFLVVGIAWLVVALVILQFDDASIATVGIIVGSMFLCVGIWNVTLATMGVPHRWAWALFGAICLVAAVISFVSPEETFTGMADILGFLFLLVGIWWIVRAFLERPLNPAWWLGLIAGILMTVMAFWTAGQFYIEKAYILLVFAGIWALMEGITDITRAFAIRKVHEALAPSKT